MKVTVHIGFEQDDLLRLDDWRKEHRLTRGAAIMTLLDATLRLEKKENSAPERSVDLEDY